MKKILIITPHLSTGGQPQYLLKKLQYLNKDYDFYVVEWQNITGGVLIVQRSQIINMLREKFFSLDDDKSHIFEIIFGLKPDVIHFEEMPETFISKEILDVIYNQNREYKIVCTTHSSFTEPKTLKYTADKFILVSNWSKRIFDSHFNGSIPSEVWEYPIEKVIYDKNQYKKELGFDLDYKHVLHVGLFTPGKNQKSIVELARTLLDHKIKFHFVGNQAGNFEEYWRPIMENFPENCIWHGERSDVDKFYMASDLFYFPSTFELNPLALKEAIAYGLPIFTKKLHTYEDTYDNIATYVTDDVEKNKTLLLNELYETEKKYKIKSVHILVDTESEREKASINSVSKISPEIEYVKCINKRYEGNEWRNHEPVGGWKNHGPGHWGCFTSGKKAILENFTEDLDALLYFEADCILDVDKDVFIEQVHRALDFCNKHNLPYFSFGPRYIKGNLESKEIGSDNEYPDFVITDSLIEAHCVLFTKKYRDYIFEQFNSNKWDALDLWFNIIFRPFNMGIVRNPIAYQKEGLSMIDNVHKDNEIKRFKNKSKRTFVTYVDNEKYRDLALLLKESISYFSNYELKIYDKDNLNIKYEGETTEHNGYIEKIHSCVEALKEYDEVVWIDADSVVTNYIDKVWFETFRIENYPLLPEHRFSMFHENESWVNIPNMYPKIDDIYFNKLGIDHVIDGKYLHGCLMLFNKNCLPFFNEVLESFKNFDPKTIRISDEIIINCLLKKYNYDNNLGHMHLCSNYFNWFLPDLTASINKKSFDDVLSRFNPKTNLYENILFFHGSKDINLHIKLFDTLKLRKIKKVSVDATTKTSSYDENSLPILIISTSRRLNYLKRTLSSLYQYNRDIKKMFKKVWVLDDRSSMKDRGEMEELFKFYFGDNYNMICFNSEAPYDFIEKHRMFKKIIEPNDIVFLLEDDWECSDHLDLKFHIKNLINSDWTQISFVDPLYIQDDNIQKDNQIGMHYWSNPFPDPFKHAVKWENDVCFWNMGCMNNFTLNPSIVKGEIFFQYDFKKIKNFEGNFADNTNTKQVFTQSVFFKHIGMESLINKL